MRIPFVRCITKAIKWDFMLSTTAILKGPVGCFTHVPSQFDNGEFAKIVVQRQAAKFSDTRSSVMQIPTISETTQALSVSGTRPFAG
jgi:hypothetical protein